jgi:hypothetical protein
MASADASFRRYFRIDCAAHGQPHHHGRAARQGRLRAFVQVAA